MHDARSAWHRRVGWGVAALVLLVCAAAESGEPAKASPNAELEAYALGHQIGMDLLRQSRAVDLEALARGLGDAFEGRPAAYDAQQLAAMLLELKRGIVVQERDEIVRGGRSLRSVGEEFMLGNAQRPGVVVRESGLQYRVLRPGDGPRPSAEDRVVVRYRSARLDGTAFHDSLREGVESETLRVSSLIEGLQEALPLMPVGSRWEIVLPPQLAFRRRGPLADHTVVYDLELLAIAPESASSPEVRP